MVILFHVPLKNGRRDQQINHKKNTNQHLRLNSPTRKKRTMKYHEISWVSKQHHQAGIGLEWEGQKFSRWGARFIVTAPWYPQRGKTSDAMRVWRPGPISCFGQRCFATARQRRWWVARPSWQTVPRWIFVFSPWKTRYTTPGQPFSCD